MDNLLNVSPGLIIWTIINFLIFLFLIIKFGAKPIMNGLRAREEKINSSIAAAEQANDNAQKILKESQEKLNSAQQDMAAIMAKGKLQAEEFLKRAAEEAEKNKRNKVEEANREIEHNKELAIKQLRTEVAGLVVEATAKILDTELDKNKQYKIVESYIQKFPNN